MKLLVQNAKMRASGGTRYSIYNFGIPAFQAADGTRTCPNAGACAAGCYALQGAYAFSNVKKAYEERFQATQNAAQFFLLMSDEINRVSKSAARQDKQLVIRIHDSGDFYSEAYLETWFGIVAAFPKVLFYCYTKQVQLLQNRRADVPKNLKVNFSLGGKQDAIINQKRDSHARVFETKRELQSLRYVDTSADDSFAFTGAGVRKIGLVYHGTKNFKNTRWGGQD